MKRPFATQVTADELYNDHNWLPPTCTRSVEN